MILKTLKDYMLYDASMLLNNIKCAAGWPLLY